MKEIEVASSTKAQNFLGRLSAPENMDNSDRLQERKTIYFGILGDFGTVDKRVRRRSQKKKTIPPLTTYDGLMTRSSTSAQRSSS